MKKEILEKLVNDGNSIRDICKITNKSFSSIRYWIKKYELKTHKRRWDREPGNEKNTKCVFCENETKNGCYYCQCCHQKLNRLRYRIALIKYKGGKCVDCGYEGNISVLEFHHKDHTQKEFGIGDGIKSWETMKKEVDKCELLCSNCHRIRHSELYWTNMYEQAKKYYGVNEELKELLK
jgi:hypothetical protein